MESSLRRWKLGIGLRFDIDEQCPLIGAACCKPECAQQVQPHLNRARLVSDAGHVCMCMGRGGCVGRAHDGHMGERTEEWDDNWQNALS